MKSPEIKKLRIYLNSLEAEYHQAHFLFSDPLEFVHHYQDPWDQEAIALLSAVLAYGNVKQIRKSIQEALKRIHQISESPKDFVRGLSQAPFKKKAFRIFEGYVHRFNSGIDLFLLFQLLNRSWSKHGSLGDHFLKFLKPEDPHIESALSQLVAEWRHWMSSRPINSVSSSSFSYLLTSPNEGSCCKRWCMFLRWMGRKDQLDLGLWSDASPLNFLTAQHRLKPSQLIMPLDTHTGRISQQMGFTLRKSLNWKAALEVTQTLKEVDPNDPTRYDFALARLGILNTRDTGDTIYAHANTNS